jgi:hypothetical protein
MFLTLKYKKTELLLARFLIYYVAEKYCGASLREIIILLLRIQRLQHCLLVLVLVAQQLVDLVLLEHTLLL